MPDDRTDAEANAEDNDGLPLFTSKTETPVRPAPNVISEADARLRAPVFAIAPGYAYRDMRGHWWNIKWNTTTFTWNAFPLKATAAAYNEMYPGTKMDPKRMYAAATDAPGIIEAVDERIEAARVEAKNSGGLGWLLLVIGGMLLLGKKGKR
jgi:hypothetical protein